MINNIHFWKWFIDTFIQWDEEVKLAKNLLSKYKSEHAEDKNIKRIYLTPKLSS